MPRHFLINTEPAEHLRQQPHITQRRKQSKPKYKLDELFESQPYFEEELIDFNNVQLDPNSDPIMLAMKSLLGRWPDEYYTKLERFQRD